MKVRELIEVLRECRSDADIVFNTSDDELDIACVTVERTKFALSGRVCLCETEDEIPRTERILWPDADAEPCTAAAFRRGCTCSVPGARSTDIDPPEPRIDRECPLHGSPRDPDVEREARRDRA